MANYRVQVEKDRESFRVREYLENGERRTIITIGKNDSATFEGKLLVGKTLAKAHAKKAEDLRHVIKLGGIDAKLRIEDEFQNFITDRTLNNYSPKHILHCEASFKAFMKDLNLELVLDITRERLIEWKTIMTKRGHTTNTIINQLSDVRTWLNWLKENGKIKVSPFGLKMMPMKKDAEPKFYTTEEFKRLDEELIKIHHSTRVLCHLAHSAGLRKSEAMGVCWEDITWHEEGADLLIRKEVAKGKKRSRTIPLDPGVLEILGSRSTGKLAPLDNEWQADHYFWKARIKSGINIDLDIHGLRHTFAKNYLQRGQGNLASLQKLMGHASIVSTMIYAQFEKSYLREGINRAYEQRMIEEGILARSQGVQ